MRNPRSQVRRDGTAAESASQATNTSAGRPEEPRPPEPNPHKEAPPVQAGGKAASVGGNEDASKNRLAAKSEEHHREPWAPFPVGLSLLRSDPKPYVSPSLRGLACNDWRDGETLDIVCGTFARHGHILRELLSPELDDSDAIAFLESLSIAEEVHVKMNTAKEGVGSAAPSTFLLPGLARRHRLDEAGVLEWVCSDFEGVGWLIVERVLPRLNSDCERLELVEALVLAEAVVDRGGSQTELADLPPGEDQTRLAKLAVQLRADIMRGEPLKAESLQQRVSGRAA
jgi:hypothetical protein